MQTDLLHRSIKVNGANKVVFNKADILDEVGTWCIYDGLDAMTFETANQMEEWILEEFTDPDIIVFSRSKDEI